MNRGNFSIKCNFDPSLAYWRVLKIKNEAENYKLTYTNIFSIHIPTNNSISIIIVILGLCYYTSLYVRLNILEIDEPK